MADPWAIDDRAERVTAAVEMMAGDAEVMRIVVVAMIGTAWIAAGWLVFGVIQSRRATGRHFEGDR